MVQQSGPLVSTLQFYCISLYNWRGCFLLSMCDLEHGRDHEPLKREIPLKNRHFQVPCLSLEMQVTGSRKGIIMIKPRYCPVTFAGALLFILINAEFTAAPTLFALGHRGASMVLERETARELQLTSYLSGLLLRSSTHGCQNGLLGASVL